MNIYLVVIIIVLVTGIILYGIYKKEKKPEVETDITDNMERRYDDILQTPIDNNNPDNGGMSAGGQQVGSIDEL